LYIGALLALPSPATLARDQALFATTDQNPFIQIYSLPSPAEGPLPEHGRWAWQFAFDLASNAIEQEAPGGRRIVLSGETYRTSISLGYRLTERLTTRFMAPYVAHSPGMLDGFIRDWHSVFGLTNGQRVEVADLALEYAYTHDGDEGFAIRERGRGLGDVRLSADYRLRAAHADDHSLVLRSGIKLPTGSTSGLRGSGSTDFSIQMLSTDRMLLSRWNTTLSWMAGALWLGDAEILDTIRRDVVAVAAVGISRPVWRGLTARVQLDGHSAFYDSKLESLGSGAVQVTFGASVELERGSRIDFAMVQNLITDTTPDLGIHIAWRGGF